MPRDLAHVQFIGVAWAFTVAGSVAFSLMTKRHLLMSHRTIHARLYAQGAIVGALCTADIVEASSPPEGWQPMLGFTEPEPEPPMDMGVNLLLSAQQLLRR